MPLLKSAGIAAPSVARYVAWRWMDTASPATWTCPPKAAKGPSPDSLAGRAPGLARDLRQSRLPHGLGFTSGAAARTRFLKAGWTCSAECTRERVAAAVRRELEGRVASPDAHRHRVPLGLTMLEQGWITSAQLRHALEAQRSSGGRLGHWLVHQQGVSEKW